MLFCMHLLFILPYSTPGAWPLHPSCICRYSSFHSKMRSSCVAPKKKKWWKMNLAHNPRAKLDEKRPKSSNQTVKREPDTTSTPPRVSTTRTTPIFNGRESERHSAMRRRERFPLPLPSKTLKRRRPRHPGFLQSGSVPRVHRVSPVHISRVQVSLGVRKASLSHSVVLAHYQRVVERRERSLVLLPPQMFGRLRAHAAPDAAAAAGDQGHRPHFAAGGVHPLRQVGFYYIISVTN